jgi:hypothetical protein
MGIFQIERPVAGGRFPRFRFFGRFGDVATGLERRKMKEPEIKWMTDFSS